MGCIACGQGELLCVAYSLQGATAEANAGVPDRLFKRHGRWKSESAKDGYIKDSMEKRSVPAAGHIAQGPVLCVFYVVVCVRVLGQRAQ